MARLHDIVFDCARPAATARFWAAALDGYAVAPYDDAEVERLRSLGITSAWLLSARPFKPGTRTTSSWPIPKVTSSACP